MVWLPERSGPVGPGPDLTETGHFDPVFSEVIQHSSQLNQLFSCLREDYPSVFSHVPPLTILVQDVRQRRDAVREIEGQLQSVLESQERYTGQYLEGGRLLLTYLGQNLEVRDQDEKDNKNLKPKQQFLCRDYQLLELTSADEKQLAEITHGINNGTIDAETTRIQQMLTGIRDAVTNDLERVQTRSDSARIIPIETYWKDYYILAQEQEILHLCFAGWKNLQNKHISHIRSMNRQSKSGLLEKSRKKIKNSIKDIFSLSDT